jgi:hypothetical protein
MFLPVIPLPPVTDTLLRSRFLYSPSCGLSLAIGLSTGTLVSYYADHKIMKGIITVSLLLILSSSIYCLQRQNRLWIESSNIAGKVNSVLVSNTDRLGSGGTVVLVNFVWDYKGIPCTPIITPEYFDYLYGFKNVKVIQTVKTDEEIQAWWARLRNSNDHVAGFVWDKDLQSIRPL